MRRLIGVLLPGLVGLSACASAADVTLQIRGRITPDTLVLEPVMRTAAAPTPTGGSGDGHRVVGADADGAVLFASPVHGTGVEDGVSEQHFAIVILVDAQAADRLARVTLHAHDGRSTTRTARGPARELRAALVAGEAVRVTRLPDNRLRLTWASDRYPLIMVRDATSGQMLALARGGEAIVATAGAVEVTISDGVQSAVWIIHR